MLGRKGKAFTAWPAGARLASAASLIFLATHLVLAAGSGAGRPTLFLCRSDGSPIRRMGISTGTRTTKNGSGINGTAASTASPNSRKIDSMPSLVRGDFQRAAPRQALAGRTTPFAERCCAGAALVASLPVLAVAMLMVRVLSGRPPLVALRRIGLHGEPFWLFKIRTMWDGPRPARGPVQGWVEYKAEMEVPEVKNGRDPRVTSRFAALCRRLSLDELPQLLQVARGTMRLAGPRPMTSPELDRYYGDAAAEVLSVLPGITGLWQVLGRNRLTYKQRLRLDLFFVRHRGWRLYLWVLLRTPSSVIRGEGAF